MVLGFTKTQQGVDAYAKIGRPYPDEIMDELYEKWLNKDKTADDLDKHTNHREKEVGKIVRMRTGEGKEFLIYSFLHYRLDEALNVTHFFRPNIGMYPIPVPRWQVNFGSFGKQERKIAEIQNNETGYSIPFSKEALEDIKNNVGFADKCQFMVQVPNGVKISVESFEDLRDCDFDALVHFGRTPTDYQRERWIKESGLDKDKHLLDEAARQKIEVAVGGGGPNIPRTFTEDQVRRMIREERQEAAAAQQTEEQQIEGKPRRTTATKTSSNK